MNKFIMLCGIQGSGKSTLAKKLHSEIKNSIILSSDAIRQELFEDENEQSGNNDVFDLMNKKTNELLMQGKTVIYDATNLSRKRRKHLIRYIVKADEYEVYYLNTSFVQAQKNNANRSRIVSVDVIEKAYKTLQIPIESEGWDRVIYYNSEEPSYDHITRKVYEDTVLTNKHNHDEFFRRLSVPMYLFGCILNLPQDSTYHSFSVSRHTFHVYQHIYENYHKEDRLMLLSAALFHDIGKYQCKSFKNFKGEDRKYANFIGHEYVSSQVASNYLYNMGYDNQFIKNVSTLVQFHMIPMNASDKKMKEIKQMLGEDMYEKLLILHEADKQAK